METSSKGFFFGDFDAMFNKYTEKNYHTITLDVDAAVDLMNSKLDLLSYIKTQ
jgi:hypothetical protein